MRTNQLEVFETKGCIGRFGTEPTILIFVGMMLQAGLTLATLKLAAIMLFLLLTGPTATYALANAALLSGLKPDADTIVGKNSTGARG